VMAADRPYGKFYDFYSVSLENFVSTHVCWTFFSLQNFMCFNTLKLFNIIIEMLKSFDNGKKLYI